MTKCSYTGCYGCLAPVHNCGISVYTNLCNVCITTIIRKRTLICIACCCHIHARRFLQQMNLKLIIILGSYERSWNIKTNFWSLYNQCYSYITFVIIISFSLDYPNLRFTKTINFQTICIFNSCNTRNTTLISKFATAQRCRVLQLIDINTKI